MVLQGAEVVEANRDHDRIGVCSNSLLPAPLLESNKDIINHIPVLVYCFCAMNITCTVGYMLKALGLECILVRNEAHFRVHSSVECFIFWTSHFVVLTLLEEHSTISSPLIWVSWHWVWWLVSAYTSGTMWASGLSLSPN